jgi:hypothetical protein
MATITIPAGDIALENGNLVFCEGAEFYRQKLAARFRFFLGEWFLDRRQGIPYYRDVFVQNPDLDLIASLFRRVILETPGVKSLASFSLAYEPGARRLSCAFQAAIVGGATITISAKDRDFIVDLSEAA